MDKKLRAALMDSCLRLIRVTGDALALNNNHSSDTRRNMIVALGDYARQLQVLELDQVDSIRPQLHPEVVFETLLAETKKSQPDTQIIILLSDFIVRQNYDFCL